MADSLQYIFRMPVALDLKLDNLVNEEDCMDNSFVNENKNWFRIVQSYELSICNACIAK